MNEQTQFKIDTSGAVEIPHGDGTRLLTVEWFNLSPSQQGTFAAALRELHNRREGEMANNARLGFRHLHPSALQRIMALGGREAIPPGADAKKVGAATWAAMQAGELTQFGLPPQTISLAEDGLIHLSEVG